jgi:hypothetical protein
MRKLFFLLFLTTIYSSTMGEVTSAATIFQQLAGCAVSAPPEWLPYRIQPGDSLVDLARTHSISVVQLMQVNCLATERLALYQLVLLPRPTLLANTATVYHTAPAPTPLAQTPTATPTIALATSTPTFSPLITNRIASPGLSLNQTITSSMVGGLAGSQPVTPTAPPSTKQTEGSIATDDPTSIYLYLSVLVLVTTALALYFVNPSFGSRNGDASNFPLLNFWGYILFVAAGFLAGLTAFPLLKPPSLLNMPAWLSIANTILLIALLCLKGLVASLEESGQVVSRALTVAIAPLLLLFLVTLVNRVVDFLQ